MPTKQYSGYAPLAVYTRPFYQTTLEDAIRENRERIREWETRHRLFGCAYKTKTTKAGRMLEVEIYPAFLDRRDYSRALKQQRTAAGQKLQNLKNAQRKFIRLLHANFTVGDISFTGNFTDPRQPGSLQACRREVRNFFNRLKYHSQKAGAGKIKYLYVIERKQEQGGAVKHHVHMVMSRNAGENGRGMDLRDWIESQWRGGDYDNTRSLQWKRGGGFTGISKYMTKQFEKELDDAGGPGLRHWGQSIGLRSWSKPPRENHYQFKKRRVERLVKGRAALKAEFEKEFPGYEYIEDYPCEIRHSDVVDGYYLYCRMYRRE